MKKGEIIGCQKKMAQTRLAENSEVIKTNKQEAIMELNQNNSIT